MPEIKLPAMSPTMEEGTLAKWLVKVGDTVKPGDVLAEIETDKATMELEADEGGVVVSLHVEAGVEGVPVGTLIATIRGEDEAAAPQSSPVPLQGGVEAGTAIPEPATSPQDAPASVAAATPVAVSLTPKGDPPASLAVTPEAGGPTRQR